MKFVLLIFVLVALVQGAKDYYKILDIAKDADEKTIKQAYRRLSKTYHPDKNQDEGAHEKFIEIGEAYEVLSNPEKRKNFDTYGDPNAGPSDNIDLGDIFNQFFGGGGGRQQRRVRRGENKHTAINVPLKTFFTGDELEFTVNKNVLCSVCEGSGSKDKKRHQCSKCQGQGIMQMRRQLGPGMVQTFQVQCDECGGKGSKITNTCKHCSGSGVTTEAKRYSIYIPPGLHRNYEHVLQGESDQSPDWVPGDLVIKIQEDFNDNWGYRRIGFNLYRTEVLTLKEAVHGNWQRHIPFFDSIDNEITLSKAENEIVINNQVDTFKGKGMPINDDEYGDLFIEYKVLVPESPETVKLVKDEL